MKKMSGPLGGFFWLTLYDVSRRTFLDNSCAYRYLKMRTLFISIFVECINKRLQRLSGLELSGSWGWTPPQVHVNRRSFLSENQLQISNPEQNFKHFGSWPPSSFGSFPTLQVMTWLWLNSFINARPTWSTAEANEVRFCPSRWTDGPIAS